jgi:hypothetical protein
MYVVLLCVFVFKIRKFRSRLISCSSYLFVDSCKLKEDSVQSSIMSYDAYIYYNNKVSQLIRLPFLSVWNHTIHLHICHEVRTRKKLWFMKSLFF